MMATYAEKLGLRTIIVHPEAFQWESKKLTGYLGDKIGTHEESWMKQTVVGLPAVVYENVFVHLARQGIANHLRQMCRKNKIPLFNPLVGHKLSVDRILHSNENTKNYLPKTKPARNVADVLQMLNQFPAVYVKPDGGYGGQGVTRIRRVASNLYQVQVDRVNDKVITFNQQMNESNLTKWLTPRLRSKHLVQQGLEFIQVDKGQVDFRVVVQRAAAGKWKLIGIVPKIAAPGGVVTNLIAGGRKVSLEWLLQNKRLDGKEIPYRKLESAALEIAQVFSKRNPDIGILGFDMGIDVHGNAWMIELNPKPARSLLSAQMREKTYESIAEFAKYLALR